MQQGTSEVRRAARRLAREKFGYKTLRAGQEAAIQAVLDGRDTLAVMPTGAGKSAIYQIAGLLVEGPVVVVSPLIALQRDQVRSITEQDAGSAVVVNATIPAGERREALEGLEAQEVKFLFLAPEQFNNPTLLRDLQASQPALVVVDEAHCISAWGHDFRPEYLRLGTIVEALGHPRVLALTATASPPIREEIIERLGMREPCVMVHGFDRPNIWLGVETYTDERTKTHAVIERVGEAEKPGIVYVGTRRHAEEVADALRAAGVQAAHYHAGMKTAERNAVQEDFMAGEIAVMVATTAFGMGVDKPDVRFVLHYDISDSVDSYYQEIGRGGRDGDPARAILFYHPGDLQVRRFLAGGKGIDVAQVERVAEVVLQHDAPATLRELREETDLSDSKLTVAISRLEDVGAVEILPSGEVVGAEAEVDSGSAAEEAVLSQERHHRLERSRIEMMRGYAETLDCRRRYILNYFGEELEGPCGHCDNCQAGLTRTVEAREQPFPLQARVAHKEWGAGTVQHYEGETVVVLFDDMGYKTLSVPLIVERGLLTGVG